MKIDDYVKTEYGKGIIVDTEFYSRIDGGIKRYGVKLDNNPFKFDVAYFWKKELTKC